MTEFEERVAKALRGVNLPQDDFPQITVGESLELACCALDAIGIDAILEALRPFAEVNEHLNDDDDYCRAARLYKELGGE